MKGVIVYNKASLAINGFFANKLKSELAALDLEAEIVDENDSLKFVPDFAVMRVYNEALNARFDAQDVRTFNNSRVAAVCNDKWKTYLMLSKAGIPVAPTQIAEKCDLPFPRVVKARHGHGGSQVFSVDGEREFERVVENMGDTSICQPHIGKKGRDLRVYVIGGKPIVAMLRSSDVDFRSNFSLGGRSSRYTLTEEVTEFVGRITRLMDFDFAGIDLFFTEDGFICNEIEDVVGCRMAYKEGIDIIKDFAWHIFYSLKPSKTLDNIEPIY